MPNPPITLKIETTVSIFEPSPESKRAFDADWMRAPSFEKLFFEPAGASEPVPTGAYNIAFDLVSKGYRVGCAVVPNEFDGAFATWLTENKSWRLMSAYSDEAGYDRVYVLLYEEIVA